MKKWRLLFALTLAAVPAAAVDWNFYGSARLATWYQSGDAPALMSSNDNGNLDVRDSELTWDLSPESRIGAKVKHHHLRGYFEYGGNADLRLLYGVWKPFGEQSWELLVGKAYTPLSFLFYAKQVYYNDNDLEATGQPWDGRKPMVQVKYEGFKLAFIQVSGSSDLGVTYADGGQTRPGDVDVLIPKIQAGYHHDWQRVFVDILGGYQTYRIEDPLGAGEDFDVDAYVIGGGAGVTIGAAYVRGFVWYGQNASQFDLTSLSPESLNGNPVAGAQVVADANGNAVDVQDTNNLGALGVIGYKLNDMFALEGGYGYLKNTNDLYDQLSGNDSVIQTWYVQATITLARGVFIVPEIGQYDYGDSAIAPGRDLKDFWYAGAKWQIDF